jgi:hypothetical protein
MEALEGPLELLEGPMEQLERSMELLADCRLARQRVALLAVLLRQVR